MQDSAATKSNPKHHKKISGCEPEKHKPTFKIHKFPVNYCVLPSGYGAAARVMETKPCLYYSTRETFVIMLLDFRYSIYSKVK